MNHLLPRAILFVFCTSLAIGISPMKASADTAASGLPLPSTLPLLDYESQLYPFIANRDFAGLNWVRDKSWRDTGPFVLDTSYGVHPAVRMYYSPEILAWLEAGAKG